jgi:hypothetical protein
MIGYGLMIVGTAIFSVKFWVDMYHNVSDIQDKASSVRENTDYLYGLGFGLAILGVIVGSFS